MRIYKEGNFRVIDTGVNVYTAEIESEDLRNPFSAVQPYFNNGQIFPVRIGEYEIIPYGSENNLPSELREILDENHITPEALNKQYQLLWGHRPALYETKYENGKRIKYWIEDKEIQRWLESWDYEQYLLKTTIEFRHINGHFTKYFRNRAGRIGRGGMIAKLEHVSSMDSRLEWNNGDPVQNIIVGDFASYGANNGIKRYQVFYKKKPFRNPVSMSYSNLYSFIVAINL